MWRRPLQPLVRRWQVPPGFRDSPKLFPRLKTSDEQVERGRRRFQIDTKIVAGGLAGESFLEFEPRPLLRRGAHEEPLYAPALSGSLARRGEFHKARAASRRLRDARGSWTDKLPQGR